PFKVAARVRIPLGAPNKPRFPNNAGDEPCVDLRLASLPEGIDPRGRRAHGFGTYRASGNNQAQLNQALRAIAQASGDAPLCPCQRTGGRDIERLREA
ncbi:MAG TPA: hypothetical protein VHG90_05745, partial [Acidimicrobiales bacterium]|nr:hypothetical protein [Acidimicrobiales bacterium]